MNPNVGPSWTTSPNQGLYTFIIKIHVAARELNYSISMWRSNTNIIQYIQPNPINVLKIVEVSKARHTKRCTQYTAHIKKSTMHTSQCPTLSLSTYTAAQSAYRSWQIHRFHIYRNINTNTEYLVLHTRVPETCQVNSDLVTRSM